MDKPYVTARKAAELIGCPIESVVEDIEAGMDGKIASLVGGDANGVWVIPVWEVEGDRLEMHRARLSVRESEVVK